MNGEIYNHRELRKNLQQPYEFLTHSDCEVILALYREKGIDFLEDLNGIFAFALYDKEKDSLPDCARPYGHYSAVYGLG